MGNLTFYFDLSLCTCVKGNVSGQLEWVAKPFVTENYNPVEDKRKPRAIHYIEFNLKEGDGTRLLIRIFKSSYVWESAI